MTKNEKDDLFYLCSLIEYIGRITKNKRSVIVNSFGVQGIKKQLKDAQVNHCLSFEQVSDELILRYKIQTGDFDTVSNCKYSVPGFMSIGRLYSRIIIEDKDDMPVEEKIIKLFNSFLCNEISDFDNDLYIENTSYFLAALSENSLPA